ncbi:hypothetical protein G7K_5020-t1 [Saitoella complicata NRRL Y-17804]|uniref:Nuclear cap-binding protein subunit 2 n=1 Tax=Saitoella complicata (strain BCRC 22490 / CBS 7301 / JCM 7358 / NBRC 10748 / NRRL Y-17804) TaxID=698492 RepID=A0A0E9NMK6_SAICN|nr:hypothetical protein G7K_5020-t1 [Saitoella complicata NRRL Y-17804]
MTSIERLDAPSSYVDRQLRRGPADEAEALRTSSTLYVGNLSFYTTEEQIHELFSKCGEIKRIIMGLDRFAHTPCGFCFVEFYSRAAALDCMKFVNGTKLDERVIRTDLDPGYKDGRQYGRGKTGGQVRDEYRWEYDAGRGGYGARRAAEEAARQAAQEKDYVAIKEVPAGPSLEYRDEEPRAQEEDGEVMADAAPADEP